ncbi:hypothetical protein BLGI_1224 [Brevibacillus laterosporus GI-9]|nr:hypothetical protein BLGI_1224 [Brevibacillus laterosporus GI-9]
MESQYTHGLTNERNDSSMTNEPISYQRISAHLLLQQLEED